MNLVYNSAYGYVYIAYNPTTKQYKLGSHTSPFNPKLLPGYVCIPIDWSETEPMLTKKLNHWKQHFSSLLKPVEQPYIKVYRNEYQLAQISGTMYKLLIRLVNLADRHTLVIKLNSTIKHHLTEDLGFTCETNSALNAYLDKLGSARIIFRIGYGTYQLNPYLFGAEDWMDTLTIRQSYCLDEFGTAMLRPKPPIQLTDEQQAYVKQMEPVFRLARATLEANRLIFGRMDELCKQLNYDPLPDWYKEYLTSLWEGCYDATQSNYSE